MNSRLMIISAAAIAIIVIVVGCGSDSDEGPAQAGNASGGAPSSPGKAVFVKQVGAACQNERKDALEDLGAYEMKHRSEGLSEVELSERALKVTLLSTIGGEIDAIRQAAAPAGDEAEIEAILFALEADLAEAKTRSGVDPIEGAFADSSKRLRSYGLSGCAK